MHEADGGFDQSTPVWAVFGDLMSGLLGAFVLLLIGVLVVQAQLAAELETEVQKRQQEEQRRQTLEQALAIPLASGRITLNNGRIGISGRLLFSLNSDQLQPDGRKLLISLVAPLRAYLSERDEVLMISGFTDHRSVRSSNRQFDDNWELSAQRALTVTRALIEEGMPASRVFAAAFGSEQPVAANTSESGRAQNRRVEMAPVPKAKAAAADAMKDALSEESCGGQRACDEALQTLQQGGAQQRDPIGYHYLQTLRAQLDRSDARTQALLLQRLTQAIAQFGHRVGQDGMPEPVGPRATPADSTAANALRSLTLQLQAESNHTVNANMAPGPGAGRSTADTPSIDNAESASVAYFRNTWSRLRVGQKVSQAMEQAPKNAGPINSHNLVLRSLALMQDVSPDYLNRFVVYVDALLCLNANGSPAARSAKRSKQQVAPSKHRAVRAPETKAR